MTYQHLLPRAKAWTITIAKRLREFFTGLEATNEVIKDFDDAVYLDMFPGTTREIGEWENQFGLSGETLTEEQRRERLAGAWTATGGQSPEYIRDTLLASGFDLYVHEWWEAGAPPAVPRNPLIVLNPGFLQVIASGNPAAQCGRAIAQCGGSEPQTKQLALVNSTPDRDIGVIPSDPAYWPFFYYLGAADYPSTANVSIELREDLETLCLKISPAQLWIGLLVRYFTGWDLNPQATSYDSVSKIVTIEDIFPAGVFFKPDGLKMYVVGDANDSIYQYTLSTAWDLSTATYDAVSKSVTTEDGNPQGVFFKPDGLKMYVVGSANDSIYQYTLAIAWDLSTATYDSVSKSVTAEDAVPTDIFFKPDGAKMYVVGNANDNVYQYTLATAWDLSTATYDSVSKSIAAEDTVLRGIFFKPDGLKMYVVGSANDTVFQYTLSAPWDVGTATYDSVSKSVTTEDTTPQGIFFKPDGTKMYMVGDGGNSVYQYTMLPPWGLASYNGTRLAVYTEDTTPTGVFFKPDGIKMYVIGDANDSIYQYTLSTAWDLSTASYDSVSKSVTAEDTTPQGIFFKPDGSKMYVIGSTNDTVYQYTLSTAWDLSTASYDSISKSVTAEDTFPKGIFFNPDGLKMYMVGGFRNRVNQYTLATAWDLSTATYDSVFKSIATEDTIPTDIFFKPDGRGMYLLGSANDSIYQYTLSPAWDLSALSYDSISKSVTAEDTTPQGIFFKPDGAKMYVVGATTDTIYEYNTVV